MNDEKGQPNIGVDIGVGEDQTSMTPLDNFKQSKPKPLESYDEIEYVNPHNMGHEHDFEKSISVHTPEFGEEEPIHRGTPVLDEENPLTDVSIHQLNMLMKQLRDVVGIMESQWEASRKDFKLTEAHMQQLYLYNEEHRTKMPEGLSQKESVKWDHCNGLDSLPEEKALEIFGEGHPIIGVQHSQTMDRIKQCFQDFVSWMTSLREYGQVNDAYLELLESGEEDQIKALREHMEQEENPEKKTNMQKAIDLYYNRKHLEFLAEPLPQDQLDRLVMLFSNTGKIQYLIDRTRTKLTQLKISQKFILEISQFEKRFLPEEYHHQSNIFLLYFMNTLVYCDINNKMDANRNKAVCIVFGMDKFIRNTWKPEIKEKIYDSMITFQNQFLGKLPKEEKGNIQD